MRITVRLFAILRDAAREVDGSEMDLPDGSRVDDAMSMLATREPALATHLSRAATAVNRAYARRDAILHDGDELALIPPVSGG